MNRAICKAFPGENPEASSHMVFTSKYTFYRFYIFMIPFF